MNFMISSSLPRMITRMFRPLKQNKKMMALTLTAKDITKYHLKICINSS